MSASGITQRGGFQRIQSCAATIASLAGEGCVTPKRNLLPTEGLAPPAHLASVNNAAVDFCVQVFDCVFSSPGHVRGQEFLDRIISSMFNFLRNCQNTFQSG